MSDWAFHVDFSKLWQIASIDRRVWEGRRGHRHTSVSCTRRTDLILPQFSCKPSRNRDLEWSHTGLSHIMATSCVRLSFAAGMFDRCLCTGVCMYVFLTAELASLALCSSCSSVCPSAVFTLLLQDLTLVYHRCCMNKVKAFPKVGSYIVCLTMP